MNFAPADRRGPQTSQGFKHLWGRLIDSKAELDEKTITWGLSQGMGAFEARYKELDTKVKAVSFEGVCFDILLYSKDHQVLADWEVQYKEMGLKEEDILPQLVIKLKSLKFAPSVPTPQQSRGSGLNDADDGKSSRASKKSKKSQKSDKSSQSLKRASSSKSLSETASVKSDSAASDRAKKVMKILGSNR